MYAFLFSSSSSLLTLSAAFSAFMCPSVCLPSAFFSQAKRRVYMQFVNQEVPNFPSDICVFFCLFIVFSTYVV